METAIGKFTLFLAEGGRGVSKCNSVELARRGRTEDELLGRREHV